MAESTALHKRASVAAQSPSVVPYPSPLPISTPDPDPNKTVIQALYLNPVSSGGVTGGGSIAPFSLNKVQYIAAMTIYYTIIMGINIFNSAN